MAHRAMGLSCFPISQLVLQLPDYAYQGPDPDGYPSKNEFIRFLEDYASGIRAPVRCNTKVLSLRNSEDGSSIGVGYSSR
jgi:putative flavoprotein involved in K+ transport